VAAHHGPLITRAACRIVSFAVYGLPRLTLAADGGTNRAAARIKLEGGLSGLYAAAAETLGIGFGNRGRPSRQAHTVPA